MLLRNAKVTKRRTKLGRNMVIVGNGSLSGGKRATLNSEINLQNQIPKEPWKKVKTMQVKISKAFLLVVQD